jgi:hypothetical protein
MAMIHHHPQDALQRKMQTQRPLLFSTEKPAFGTQPNTYRTWQHTSKCITSAMTYPLRRN